MREILIVGAGQSGLQLALGLRRHGYHVTVASDRTPDQVWDGPVMSTQCMFDTALSHERRHELDLWSQQAPQIRSVGVAVAAGDTGEPAVNWFGRLRRPAQSVDQRVKFATWMRMFEAAGGRLWTSAVTADDLDELAHDGEYDLIVVATGKGELSRLFARDDEHTVHSRPQRALSAVYVHGMLPAPEHPEPMVRCNLLPGLGELFVMPALTRGGPCDILFFEALPGGPLDVFDELRADPRAHLDRTLELMRRFVPWEHQRCGAVDLTDEGGHLVGRYPPVVCHPVAQLPSGGLVLGMADAVVRNDPITGQGANNASLAAALYLEAILGHGDRPFDGDWMRAAFAAYWARARHATAWSNAMLAPPPRHVLLLLAAGQHHAEVADRFANAFDNPEDLADWFFDPESAGAFLSRVHHGLAAR
ncbi:styrene monooxygenase/indole monooxygenase family protein [Goodfellowiella coeruleoviolacea]|uniref:2-polyprenyl-6-methoxyphenol hydroxylase n=1 Tax=Goodfellowiella coeruleoviolacea TaxID=334858 RepID=A0AAE3GHT7_9PSEU|nr:styrene monooxygenase/indole monooxygenase family protein [Goodfellowiella coeruleoviolacea]MCP2168461.1 2-polyprenyl-6-methoxyphenol hydroxylase [Goodfellowiella coeruleoviolacea]